MRELIKKVESLLAEDHDTKGLDIRIMSPAEATRFSLERMKEGKDTISVHRERVARLPHRPVPDSRNRDQRQDALDRSAAERRRALRDRRGRLGAEARAAVSGRRDICGGIRSANSWRWPPHWNIWPRSANNQAAKILADTLDQANAKFLESNKSPARKVGEIDNRGSHFYLALYWAQALAAADAG